MNSVFLLALCFTIIVDAIYRFIETQALERIDLVLGVGAGGLALNIISLILFAIQHCQESKENKKKK